MRHSSSRVTFEHFLDRIDLTRREAVRITIGAQRFDHHVNFFHVQSPLRSQFMEAKLHDLSHVVDIALRKPFPP